MWCRVGWGLGLAGWGDGRVGRPMEGRRRRRRRRGGGACFVPAALTRRIDPPVSVVHRSDCRGRYGAVGKVWGACGQVTKRHNHQEMVMNFPGQIRGLVT